MATIPPKLVPMTRRAITLLAVVSALSLAVPMAAGAASGGTASQAITDCNDHGQLTQQYSASTLRAALAKMPVDVKEYTDCYDVIERQLFKQLGSSAPAGTATTGSSSGSSFLPTWLIIVIVVLALAAVTFGALAVRRRSGGPGAPGAGGPGAPGPGGPGAGGPGPVGPGAGGPDAPGAEPGAGGPSAADAPTERVQPAPPEPPEEPGEPPAT
jgi:hypothetical protein